MRSRTRSPFTIPSAPHDRAADNVATKSATASTTTTSRPPCACGCGQPVNPGTRGEPKRFATSRCRSRAWDRANPRVKASEKVHPFVAEIERRLSAPEQRRELEAEPKRELTIADEVNRILDRAR